MTYIIPMTIRIPAGYCPVKLKGHDRETVEKWADRFPPAGQFGPVA